MPRIVGVDIQREKRVEIALGYLYGVGRASAKQILRVTGVDPNKRAKDLTDQEIAAINSEVQKNYKVEGDLRREVQQNIKRLMDIRCYRGIRHIRGLPTRGQRTHTNARTRKGPRQVLNVKIIKKPPAPT